jgi:hypothetical protein
MNTQSNVEKDPVEKDPIEEYCLALSVQFPETIPNSGLAAEYFFLPGNRALADKLIELSNNRHGHTPFEKFGIDEDSPLGELLEQLLSKDLPPMDFRDRSSILQNTVKRLENRYLRDLKLKEEILLEESDNDLTIDPQFSILTTNQRIKTNETNRTWIGTITQDRR